MPWKCMLGQWFGHDCNYTVGAILLLALFLCVIYIFCLNNHHHHMVSRYRRPPRKYIPPPVYTPPPPPVYTPPRGTPTYTVSLDDKDGPVMGKYTSTELHSTPGRTIHNLKTTDPDHQSKDIEVHYHSDNRDAHLWPKPSINNEGDLEIKDYGNTMKGHLEVHSDGRKIAHQEVTPEPSRY